MKTYEVLKTLEPTADGLHIYNFQFIPQTGYIKVYNLFSRSDRQMINRAIKMLKGEGLLPAMVEIKEV